MGGDGFAGHKTTTPWMWKNRINHSKVKMKEFKDIKVAVAGTGYVGLSIATLLSQHHHVTAVDETPGKSWEGE